MWIGIVAFSASETLALYFCREISPESTWQIFLDAAVRVGLERDEIARVAAAG